MDPSTMYLVTGLLLGLLLKDHMVKSVEGQKFELPETIRVLHESCVVIPCKFTYAKPKPTIIGLRYLRDSLAEEIYNSLNSSSVLESFLGRVSLVGDLAKGNCTVKIDKLAYREYGRYFPHIYSDPPTAEVMNNSVYLNVYFSPEDITLSGPEEMIEGNTYVFTCRAKHSCRPDPPILTWNFRNLNFATKQTHRELPNGEWETSSVLSYIADSVDNWKSLECRAEYPENSIMEKRLWVRIFYPPKMVSIHSTHDTGHVRKGENVVLTCEGNGNPNILEYTWYKNNTSVRKYEYKNLYIHEMTQDDSGQYYCEAGNKVGKTKSEPITLLCIDCESSQKSPMRGVVAAGVLTVVVLLILGVVVLIWYRKKKASRPPRPPRPAEASIDIHTYMNVQVPVYPKPLPENPYVALQTHNRCPNYDEIQLQDTKAAKKPTLQPSSSYSEYEEVIPFRCQRNNKWNK